MGKKLSLFGVSAGVVFATILLSALGWAVITLFDTFFNDTISQLPFNRYTALGIFIAICIILLLFIGWRSKKILKTVLGGLK